MRHRLLADYLDRVEQALAGCEGGYVERYVEEILTPERANLRIRIRFESGHLLEINEAIVVVEDGLTWLDYRYHCQDDQNQLLFRYDSTPHFPDLPGFPHHKHLPDQVTGGDKPDLRLVIEEAKAALD
jgi:hypothetical protein